jgi:nucleotide sugar dehydrogenase
MSSLGIIGQGFVGNAVYKKFRNYYDVATYDLDSSKANATFDEVCQNKLIFLCLPTPMNQDGSCNIDIIEDQIKNLDEKGDYTIVVKSTIAPGTTERWNKKYQSTIVFNPEFLTERNAEEDYNNQERIILGGPIEGLNTVKPYFDKVFPNAKIIKTESTLAEQVKYFTNTFLSVKVSFANEMYKLCKGLDIDYDKVVELATYDSRLGNSHWSVPGHDGDFGFGGHCFPKDLAAIIHLTKNLGTSNNVLMAAQQTNDEVRKNRDWEQMKGRAVI